MITMDVSVIIPCYNEEKNIAICLRALVAQTRKPLEIIVVDNNSTDGTAAVASSFGARVVTERKQGITAARSRGFDEARGDILARTDADSIVPPDWIERIHADFEAKKIDALTGPTMFYDHFLSSTSYSSFYLLIMKMLQKNHETLLGPNMALTKNAWLRVRSDICLDDKLVHEDIDLGAHLALHNKRVSVDPKLIVKISGRRLKNNPLSFFLEYPKRVASTLGQHKI